MRAIILAAGRGQRLQFPASDGRPKCLIELAGKSLLSRQLSALEANGIRAVSLVVGYEAQQITQHLEELDSELQIDCLLNPEFELGSVLSLLTALRAVEGNHDVLILDADVLFHPQILDRLCQSIHSNCLLLDTDFLPGEEPVKIAIREGAVVEFRKALPEGLEYETLGESVGFFRFNASTAGRLTTICEQFVTGGKTGFPHEDAIRQLILQRPQAFGVEDVSGMPWIEIDFPEDITRATQVVLPAIEHGLPIISKSVA